MYQFSPIDPKANPLSESEKAISEMFISSGSSWSSHCENEFELIRRRKINILKRCEASL
jgi:hypothetical protein